MQSKAATPEEYVESLPDERREAINKLRKVIRKNLPKGFAEEMSYGMIGYVVPHKLYPKGYHCDPKLPLPFLNIAGHTFRGRANQGQLKIVDGTGAVHGYVSDNTAFHQINNKTRQAHFEHVRPHHQDDLPSAVMSRRNTPGQRR